MRICFFRVTGAKCVFVFAAQECTLLIPQIRRLGEGDSAHVDLAKLEDRDGWPDQQVYFTWGDAGKLMHWVASEEVLGTG